MNNIGSIIKSKNGTSTNQSFLMFLMNDSFLILFDNMTNGIIGDSTKINIEDFELSTMREFAEFIINNNI